MEIKKVNEYLDKSIACRWSPIVAKAGWTPIANVFIENYCKLDINPNEAMFLIHCFMYKWTVDKPYVSLTKVSIQMGKSRDTVQRYAKELEKKGFIKRIYRTRLPSLVNLNPLIKAMETFAIHPTLTKVPMQNIRTTYAKAHTKEEPLRRTITEFNKSKGIQHISEVMTWRK